MTTTTNGPGGTRRLAPAPPAVAARAVADALAEGGLLWLAGRSALFLAAVVGLALLL